MHGECLHMMPGAPNALQGGRDVPGLPTWMTRSTLPMSIPISKDEEVTTARSSPCFRRCSTSSRIFLSIEPW